ncbi:hypothetical protein E2562_022385 [Oryza meyeriana var. granulata]|uniref:Uncharacterized protein n=1 Tax=Oryza meyeriana var. granulata TaxID=110450 RepID=A0A6G1EY79_9ORYZ|nr:hypothetical protein E2562_022385 [Oryza meyeriana var. granulata]
MRLAADRAGKDARRIVPSTSRHQHRDKHNPPHQRRARPSDRQGVNGSPAASQDGTLPSPTCCHRVPAPPSSPPPLNRRTERGLDTEARAYKGQRRAHLLAHLAALHTPLSPKPPCRPPILVGTQAGARRITLGCAPYRHAANLTMPSRLGSSPLAPRSLARAKPQGSGRENRSSLPR